MARAISNDEDFDEDFHFDCIIHNSSNFLKNKLTVSLFPFNTVQFCILRKFLFRVICDVNLFTYFLYLTLSAVYCNWQPFLIERGWVNYDQII